MDINSINYKLLHIDISSCNYGNNGNNLMEVKRLIDNRLQLAVSPTSLTKIKQFVSETSNSK